MLAAQGRGRLQGGLQGGLQGEEVGAAGGRAVQLYRAVRYLRRLETAQLQGGRAASMWQGRGLEMAGAMRAPDRSGGGEGGEGGGEGGEGGEGSEGGEGKAAAFSLTAFAWGGVWYHAAWLPACNAHAESRAAISRAVLTLHLALALALALAPTLTVAL